MKKKYNFPDVNGNFLEFGGNYTPPALKQVLQELSQQYEKAKQSTSFQKELSSLYRDFAGRPSNLYLAKNLTRDVGGAKIYLKREDLNHTGAHKINNTLGQGLLAKRMGRKKLIAETGAGQHGVATATVAALFGMDCDIYMGSRDIEAQKPNVYRMKILGANVQRVEKGQGTLKDAVDVALQNYIQEANSSHYLLGSVVGPHPYPVMVRDFQKIIGQEIRTQILDREGALPHTIIACVGGGSNAMGSFYDFIEEDVNLIAVEPAGKGEGTKKHGLALKLGQTGLIHAFKTLVLKDEDGQVQESYSAASGLDYPGVGPELSMLKEQGRLKLGTATDQQAVQAFMRLSKAEGIIPALESAHAVSFALSYAKDLSQNESIVINLSGRGDKDVENVFNNLL